MRDFQRSQWDWIDFCGDRQPCPLKPEDQTRPGPPKPPCLSGGTWGSVLKTQVLGLLHCTELGPPQSRAWEWARPAPALSCREPLPGRDPLRDPLRPTPGRHPPTPVLLSFLPQRHGSPAFSGPRQPCIRFGLPGVPLGQMCLLKSPLGHFLCPSR